MSSNTIQINHNCYNIIPIILIQLCIVLLFEFFIYYFVINAKLYMHISHRVDWIITIIELLLNSHKQNTNTDIDNEKNYGNTEKNYINKMNTTGIIIFTALIIGIIILFISYVYIVIYIMKIKMDWVSIVSVSIGTFLLIAIMESLYIFKIQSTTFNGCKIEINFLNKLKNIKN